jgi:hypothetical protein
MIGAYHLYLGNPFGSMASFTVDENLEERRNDYAKQKEGNRIIQQDNNDEIYGFRPCGFWHDRSSFFCGL